MFRKSNRGKKRARKPRDSTAQELLDVAEALFVERGYAATTIGAVVRRANVTSGALYHAFADKKALFTGVAERVVARLVDRAREATVQELDPWKKLGAGLDAILALADAPDVKLAFLEAPLVLGLETWREIETRATAPLLGSVLEELVAKGRLDPVRAPLVGRILRGAMIEATMALTESDQPAIARKELRALLAGVVASFSRSR